MVYSMLLRLAALVAVMVQSIAAQAAFPVVVDGSELWRIRAPRAGFSPAERADDIRASIAFFAEDRRRSLDDWREAHLDSESILLGGRVYLFSVTDVDAALEGRPRKVLFDERKVIALGVARKYRDARSITQMLRSGAMALCVLLAAIVTLVILRFAYRRTSASLITTVERLSGHKHMGALYQELEGTVFVLTRFSVRLVFLSAAVLVCSVAVEVILSLFPATAGFSGVALAGAVDAARNVGASIAGYLPNLIVLGCIGAFIFGMLRVAGAIARAVESGALTIPNFYREWAAPTYGLIRVILILFGLVVAFPYLPGGDSPALRGVSIFIGVLVSLGSGSAMGNVIAGVIITYMRPFQMGDRVKIADTIGNITDKSLLVTRIRTIKNVEVILPNSAILGAHIVNYSANARDHGLILNTTITIGYDAYWETVRSLLVRAALKTPHILSDPQPFVFHTSLNDYHVSYEINATTKEENQMAYIYSELHKNIQEEFNAAGVEIMSPSYLALREGNTVTIPADQRSPEYLPPSFRVHVQPEEGPSDASNSRTRGHATGGSM